MVRSSLFQGKCFLLEKGRGGISLGSSEGNLVSLGSLGCRRRERKLAPFQRELQGSKWGWGADASEKRSIFWHFLVIP